MFVVLLYLLLNLLILSQHPYAFSLVNNSLNSQLRAFVHVYFEYVMVDFIHMYATYKRICGLPQIHTFYDSQVPKTGRRELLGIGLLGLGSLPIAFPEAANAGTPVRAPLPNGPPDPSDWAKLIEATKLVETWSNTQHDRAFVTVL